MVIAEHASGSVDQSTAHPTPKLANLGIGGGLLIALLASLKAHGVNLFEEDIALLLLVVPWMVGYFTRDKK
jgi:hypothetical protein